MITFVRFYRKRNWHIVRPGHELEVAADVPTVCGEPSIAVQSGDQVEILRANRPPAYVCPRCQKANL